jgi:hypothetical protein
MPDVNIPGVGSVPKGGVVLGAIAGLGGTAYVWYKHKKDAESATSDSNAATASGTGGASYAYGYGYGGYGYGNADSAFNEPYIGGEYGYGGAYGYGIGEGYGVGSPTPVTTPTALATTNQAWAQAAENYLVENGGYDQNTVAAALGMYITGSTVTADQQAVIEAAIAFEGYPPQPGANNYPPNIHTSASTGQSGGGGGTGTSSAQQVTVPVTFGMSASAALAAVRKAGFTATTSPLRNPKNTYISTGSKPEGGTKASKGSKVVIGVKKV